MHTIWDFVFQEVLYLKTNNQTMPKANIKEGTVFGVCSELATGTPPQKHM